LLKHCKSRAAGRGASQDEIRDLPALERPELVGS